MCGDCGGEYACHSWCPSAKRYENARRVAEPLEDRIEALEQRLTDANARYNIMWSALSLIGDPGPETIKLDPRGATTCRLRSPRTGRRWADTARRRSTSRSTTSGSRPTGKHEDYKKHYPDGYEVVWVDDVPNHAGVQAAIAKHNAANAKPTALPNGAAEEPK
jgi:hypothetical protein